MEATYEFYELMEKEDYTGAAEYAEKNFDDVVKPLTVNELEKIFEKFNKHVAPKHLEKLARDIRGTIFGRHGPYNSPTY